MILAAEHRAQGDVAGAPSPQAAEVQCWNCFDEGCEVCEWWPRK